LRAVLLTLASICLPQAALAAGATCLFQMAGQDVLVGPCDATDRDPTGTMQVASPDGTIVARIESAGGGVGQAFWNDGKTKADTLIGPVVLIGACWASDKTKLCVTR
jgi:hypothetical protein